MVLGEWGGVARGTVREGGLRHVLGAHGPAKEGVDEAPGEVVACVPGVDVGLGALGEGASALGEVAEEGGREVEFTASLLDLFPGERAAAGECVQPVLDMPGGEEFQQSPVPGVADSGEFLRECALEEQQLPVGRGQDVGLDEQITHLTSSRA
ncbi:hypothetical protein SCWH03_58030 [Streptomyces pacificus]|uniref:Uncharacterized protein n=1 Tax=Streptomyces pacificus TaxID=2705029 RepID=A0A6A0B4B3_9ACTN|nr:hypothetical protein SCWH03_58030 [Streptomyces pacificus]